MQSDDPRWSRTALIDGTILVMVVLGFYFGRLTDLSVRGEESRWGSAAQEMLRTGDWIVPRQQGHPFLSRPPMGSWLIALTAAARGECDLVAIRFPTAMAVLGLTLLIFAYTRSYLGRLGAFAAGLAFASFPEILQMGRLGESDAVFAFFLGGALITWHWGDTDRWRPALRWGIPYVLLAGATLTKGPQAPVIFGGTVLLYLVVQRRFRDLVTPAHAFGILLFAVLLGSWLVPFQLRLGFESTWRILAGDSADRFVGWKSRDVLAHLIQYPVEVSGCTAPWSLVLVALMSRRVREQLAPMSAQLRYFGIALIVAFLPCWITPGGQTRYVMPVYPGVAILVGIVVERMAAFSPSGRLRFLFRTTGWYLSGVMAVTAAALVWLTWGSPPEQLASWQQPSGFVVFFVLLTGSALVLHLRRGLFSLNRVHGGGLLAMAMFLGFAYAGAVVNQLVAMQTDAEARMQELKRRLPQEVTLRSLGPVHHKFGYLYGQPIEQLPNSPELIPPGAYFCYSNLGSERRSVPFPTDEVAVICMDRLRLKQPEWTMVVARRRPATSNSESSLTRK